MIQPSHIYTEETPETLLERRQMRTIVRGEIRRLDRRSRAIIERRLSGETFAAIAKKFGICRERARQIETRAKRKLEKKLVLFSPVSLEVKRARALSEAEKNLDHWNVLEVGCPVCGSAPFVECRRWTGSRWTEFSPEKRFHGLRLTHWELGKRR